MPDDDTLSPRSFVVPRDHVATAAWISHMHWLTEPGIATGKRNATLDQPRVAVSVFAPYENRWDLVHVDTAEPSSSCRRTTGRTASGCHRRIHGRSRSRSGEGASSRTTPRSTRSVAVQFIGRDTIRFQVQNLRTYPCTDRDEK